MEANIFVDKLHQDCLKEKKIEEFQISYAQSRFSSLSVFDSKVDKSEFKEAQEVSLDVKIKGKKGSFSCEELEEQNISLIISKAIDNAIIIDDEDESFFHNGEGEYQAVIKPQSLWKELEQLDKQQFLKDLEARAYELDSRIKKVMSCSYGCSETKAIMRNSLGLDLKEDDKSAYAYIYLSAQNGDKVTTGSAVQGFEKIEDFSVDTLAKKAVNEAVAKLEAVDIDSGKKEIVFKNETFGEFLQTIKGVFSANAVQEKHSKLAGKLGQVVASTKFSLIDDALLPRGYGTRSFDNEGYPSQTNVIIENGELKTFLHNLRTAHKDKVKSTGNGSGGRGVSTGNLYIKPGEKSLDEVLKSVKNGVYLDELKGLHAGFNIVSGDFSFGAGGFMIENGKITEPLNPFTVAGNVYELLKNVEMVANDLDFNFSKYGSPAVWIRNLTIANK